MKHGAQVARLQNLLGCLRPALESHVLDDPVPHAGGRSSIASKFVGLLQRGAEWFVREDVLALANCLHERLVVQPVHQAVVHHVHVKSGDRAFQMVAC